MALVSCTTYTIPVESFNSQMVDAAEENMRSAEINNPLTYGSLTYPANNIDRLIVINEDGKRTYLTNSPSIEMRVTHVNGKRYKFYFDTVYLENDTLKAERSRFIAGLSRQIPLDSIVKIEVQDGGKKFNYQN